MRRRTPGTFVLTAALLAVACGGQVAREPGGEEDGTGGADAGEHFVIASQPLSAGTDHNCALAEDGSVACWGRGEDGRASPPSETFAQVSAGSWYTCGVKADGKVVCWG